VQPALSVRWGSLTLKGKGRSGGWTKRPKLALAYLWFTRGQHRSAISPLIEWFWSLVDCSSSCCMWLWMLHAGCVNLSFAFVEGESMLMALKDVALSSGRWFAVQSSNIDTIMLVSLCLSIARSVNEWQQELAGLINSRPMLSIKTASCCLRRLTAARSRYSLELSLTCG